VLYRQCPVFIITTHLLVVQLRTKDKIKGDLKKKNLENLETLLRTGTAFSKNNYKYK